MAAYTDTNFVNAQPSAPPLNSSGGVAVEEKSYWETPETCHPGRQAFSCPIALFIILMVLGAIINIWALFRAPRKNKEGRDIGTSELWVAFFIGVGFHLLIGIFAGWWIYNRCRSCTPGSSGLVFVIAVIVPIVSALLTGVIIGSVLDVGFLWTAAREPNREGDV